MVMRFGCEFSKNLKNMMELIKRVIMFLCVSYKFCWVLKNFMGLGLDGMVMVVILDGYMF